MIQNVSGDPLSNITDDSINNILKVLNYSKHAHKEDVENKYKDIVVDQLISEVTFLRDEIIYMREDARKKADHINYLTQFIFQNQNTENKLRENVHKMSSYSTLNSEHFINNTFSSKTSSTCTNELSDDNREKIILLNDTCNSEWSKINQTDNEQVIVEDTLSQFTNDFHTQLNLLHQENLNSTEQLRDVNETTNENNNILTQQLKEVRSNKHMCFLKDHREYIDLTDERATDKHLWPKGTICIRGDSMLQGLDEHRLGRNKNNVKVRCFPGAQIDDMYSYCKPIILKQPSYIILHVGTNDSNDFTSRKLIEKIVNLKVFIESELPTCKIIISMPIRRTDKAKCNLTINHLNDHLMSSNLHVIDNDNILEFHIGKKGLHLNAKGTGRLALNIISCIR